MIIFIFACMLIATFLSVPLHLFICMFLFFCIHKCKPVKMSKVLHFLSEQKMIQVGLQLHIIFVIDESVDRFPCLTDCQITKIYKKKSSIAGSSQFVSFLFWENFLNNKWSIKIVASSFSVSELIQFVIPKKPGPSLFTGSFDTVQLLASLCY